VLLALDTATKTVGLAIHDGAQVLAECTWRSQGHHSRELAPEVAMMLRRVGVQAPALTALAVSLGPGSFNGLRIGMALAKGMALAHNLPLIGIPTHDILARLQPRRDAPLVVVIEAGRGRVAALWYKWSRAGWKAQGEPEGLGWDDLLARFDRAVYLCGEIDPDQRRALGGDPRVALAPPSECVRRPGILAEMAWEKLKGAKRPEAATLAPIYLRMRDEGPR
jgi:tRNA threonylcarbamoyladenosine biosynthesis protein TsaB